ncbi:MAG TPA: hypothetical protein VGB73_18855 [Pyrinomonadaceae bacterium]|jgi:hypothetical protein
MQPKTVAEALQNEELRALMPKELLLLFEGTKKQRERLNAKYRKERLDGFIELANLLPPNYVVADLDEIIGRDEEGFDSSEEQFLHWIKKYKVLLIYLEKFPSNFKEYVLENSQDYLTQINMNSLTDNENIKHVSEIHGALRRYDEFRDIREKLRRLIRITQFPSDKYGFALMFLNRISVYASLWVGKDGIAKVNLDTFAETINGVEVTRIRACNDCQRIFWAKRKDQSCCSKDCANRYHVRQHREKYASDPIAYKLRRLDRKENSDAKKGR